MQAIPSRAIVLHYAQSWRDRVVRAVAARVSPRTRQRALRALKPLTSRWPLLAELVRATGVFAKVQGAIIDVSVEGPGDLPGDARTETTMNVSELVAVLRSSRDFRERVEAARSLGSVPGDESTAGLVVALRDASAEVAVEAALALRHHPGQPTLTALRQVVETWDRYFDATVRAAAIRSLGVVLPRNDGALLERAVSSVDTEVSLAAISALVERGEPSGAARLIGLLEDRTGFYLPLTRAAAARGLVALRFDDAAQVRSLLETEEDRDVRTALSELPGGARPS
jgi:hypothetical protein